uniref:HotDog ACOT-type domain-containing protein n=1 Tax=Glossina brevipalpis TaxID=37001 RepID=A0A1A9WRN5_9MUSC
MLKIFRHLKELCKFKTPAFHQRRFILMGAEPTYVGTITEVRKKVLNQYGVTIGYQSTPPKRDHLLKYTTKQEKLPACCMKNSYIMTIIPLATEKIMQEIYINDIGTLRIGRLLEAMDIFAAHVCQQYVNLPDLPSNESLPYCFVTFMVDGTRVQPKLPVYGKNVRITGYISWVGKTSLEVSVWVHIVNEKDLIQVTKANFLMAARNATNTGSADVNAIKTCNDEEKNIFNEGALRTKRRKEKQKISALRTKPTAKEHELIYDIIDKTTDKLSLELNKRSLPPNSCWIMIDNGGIEYPKPLPKLNLENVCNEMGFTPLEMVALQNIWRLFKKRFKHHSMQIFLAFFNENHKLIEKYRLPNGKFQLSYLCHHSEKMLILYENVIDKCLDNMANFHGIMADVTLSHRNYGVTYEDVKLKCEHVKHYILNYFRNQSSPTLVSALEKLSEHFKERHRVKEGDTKSDEDEAVD